VFPATLELVEAVFDDAVFDNIPSAIAFLYCAECAIVTSGLSSRPDLLGSIFGSIFALFIFGSWPNVLFLCMFYLISSLEHNRQEQELGFSFEIV
jgi:hypothetical protein